MPDFFAQFAIGLVLLGFIGFGLLLLLLRRGKDAARWLLSAFFITLGLAVLDNVALVRGFYFEFPRLAYWLVGLPLLWGPLLYRLTHSVVYHDHRYQRSDLIHLLPYLLLFCSGFFLYHFHDVSYQREFLRRASAGTEISAVVVSFIIFCHIGYYIFSSLRLIRGYRHELERRYSNLNRKGVRWLERVLYGFALLILLSAVAQILIVTTRGAAIAYATLTLVALGMIGASIFQGLRESELFGGISAPERTGASGETPSPRAEVDRILLARLTDYMEQNQPYLQADLSLNELAGQLNLVPRELSHLINAGLDRTFFDLINGYRIRHAQQLLLDTSDVGQTILEVMYRVGFNSKSSFNTAFRKHTGMTPSQWKRRRTT